MTRTLRLHAGDNVVVAVDPITPGTGVEGAVASARVPRGHKMAVRAIADGEPILKFGQIIGFAAGPIAPGDWVHEHNVAMRDFARDYRFAEAAGAEDLLPPGARATFEGYRRSNGRVGTRNYIGILTSVNCSATSARFMAQAIERSGVLSDYPNVDGVIPLVHGGGCALDVKGEGYD
ncbi:MAG: UxaA family hydrolase, partial [Rhodospirillales bacterium]